MSEPVPRVYLCGERGCGSRSERRELEAALAGAAEVVTVSCQSVCKGPVAGTIVGGRLQWFARLRTGKARTALARLTSRPRTELPGSLAKRRVAKRAGKLRGRVTSGR